MGTSVRSLLRANAGLISRAKRVDGVARRVIHLVGWAVVASVMAILVFTLAQAVPLFRSAHFQEVAERARPASAGTGVLVDEYETVALSVTPEGTITGVPLRGTRELPPFRPSCLKEGIKPSVVSVEPLVDLMSIGFENGSAAVVRPSFTRRFEGGDGGGESGADSGDGASVDVSYSELFCGALAPAAVRSISASLVRDGEAVRVGAISDGALFLVESSAASELLRIDSPNSGTSPLTLVRFGARDALAAASTDGRIYHWLIETATAESGPKIKARFTDELKATQGTASISAMEWLLGGTTLLVGDTSGSMGAFFRTRRQETDDEPRLTKIREFPELDGAVATLSPGRRDRTFLALSTTGDLRAFFGTTARQLASARVGTGGAEASRDVSVAMSPRGAGFSVVTPSKIVSFRFSNPHPEVSAGALFGKLWYEGYPEAEAVWQSTGGTDDFEVKLSLLPLIFGTIKGTFYALLFAIPIAVTAALYVSQFATPGVRAIVKPAVEIMAALPSVVIGFIAGLWFAPMADRHLMTILLMMAATPFLGVFGFAFAPLLRSRVPRSFRDGGMEILVTPFVLLAGYAALAFVSPTLEAMFFSGDVRTWISEALGLTYDQRNCLVVGVAMGFAVIPIIFTISEDALSSVPSNLTAASLALGASSWQTALSIVLPTASPGVFSAIMVGFGRAVGETMIVLMATGNTPVVDWSIFNGMRTLSANIAVEISEAPQGGTLYRTLFLTASLLFAMTFVVNTLAEVIRHRLRQRYRAL